MGSEPCQSARTLLITRSRRRSQALARGLAALGFGLECRPTIALEPPRDERAPARAVQALDRYHWVVFTSRNGVRYFVDRLHRELRQSRGDWRVAAVGQATANALGDAGIEVDHLATRSDAAGLAADLVLRVSPGERVLLVRPEVAGSELASSLTGAGAEVDSVAFYRNVAAPDLAETARRLCSGRFDALILTSPSSLLRLLELREPAPQAVRQALCDVALIALGETTGTAIREHGFRVAAVAAEPTDRGLIEAVQSLESRGERR